MGNSGRREVVYRSVIVLSIIAGAIVSCENVARWLRPAATRTVILDRIESERYRWRRPDAEFHHVGDGIFALRFPSREAEHRRRVMIVGDSFAMGHGVDEQERFGALLQRNLGDAVSVDVLATSSYSPIIYRNIVDRALATTRYDAVAVFVDQTDPVDDLVYRHDLLAGEGSRHFDVDLMQERNRAVERAYDTMENNMHGWTGVARRSAIFNLAVRPPTILDTFPRDNRHFPYVELSLARWQLAHIFDRDPEHEATVSMERRIMRHIDEIVERCRKEGVPLLLAANPWRHHVIEPGDEIRDSLDRRPPVNRLESIIEARYASRAAVRVLPLTEAFRRHPGPERLYLGDGEIHWSPEGHAEVERTLREAVRLALPGDS